MNVGERGDVDIVKSRDKIGDCIDAVRDDEMIGIGTTGKRVIPGTPIENVGARPADQRVISRPTRKRIVTRTAVETIVSAEAFDMIVSAAADNRISNVLSDIERS